MPFTAHLSPWVPPSVSRPRALDGGGSELIIDPEGGSAWSPGGSPNAGALGCGDLMWPPGSWAWRRGLRENTPKKDPPRGHLLPNFSGTGGLTFPEQIGQKSDGHGGAGMLYCVFPIPGWDLGRKPGR